MEMIKNLDKSEVESVRTAGIASTERSHGTKSSASSAFTIVANPEYEKPSEEKKRKCDIEQDNPNQSEAEDEEP